MNTKSFILPVAISIGLSMPSAAAPKQELHLVTVTKATPIDRVKPRYPKTAALKGGEGWVKLSYIVNEDGSVSSPIVVKTHQASGHLSENLYVPLNAGVMNPP